MVRRSHLCLTDGASCLDIDDDRMVGVDQIIVGIVKEGRVRAARPVQCVAGSERRDKLGSHLAGSVEAGIIQPGKIVLNRAVASA